MKQILILATALLLSAVVYAQSKPSFRCIGVQGTSIKFYTKLWSGGFDRLKVKYTDSYYGDGGKYEPDLDRAYEVIRDGAKYVFDVPGVGIDRMQLVIDTSTTGRMPHGGKEWGSRSRVYHGSFQIADGKPLPVICELAYW